MLNVIKEIYLKWQHNRKEGKFMYKYETIMLFGNNTPEENRNNVITKIKKYIETIGKIENSQDIGKRRLAYEINKNKEAYYYTIEFTAKSEYISELERIYRITDEIIKFIVVKKD